VTNKEMDLAAKAKGKDGTRRFLWDMRKAGLKTRHYRGRNFWSGPAVDCGDLQEVLSCTKVPCQWDQMGKGFIVYPRESLGDWTREGATP
jgi:hypothetical protein